MAQKRLSKEYHCVLVICLAGLVSCARAPVSEPERDTTLRALPPSPPLVRPGTRSFQIDAAASKVHILVYRGGTMARLGHNHVISSSSIRGTIWQDALLSDAGFDILVPVNTLIVDDNAARAAEGDDFPLNLSDDTKSGTKANMLRETLLDGARYPDINIRSVSVQGSATAPVVVAAIRIKDQTRQVTVPVKLAISEGRIQAQGEFEILQTDFGITPLSVALGALQVVDTVKIKFEISAMDR